MDVMHFGLGVVSVFRSEAFETHGDKGRRRRRRRRRRRINEVEMGGAATMTVVGGHAYI